MQSYVLFYVSSSVAVMQPNIFLINWFSKDEFGLTQCTT